MKMIILYVPNKKSLKINMVKMDGKRDVNKKHHRTERLIHLSVDSPNKN